MNPFLLLWLSYHLLLPSKALGDDGEGKNVKFSIGAIADFSFRTGKEEMTAMKMAINDYFNYTNNKPVLHIKDSGKDPTQTAVAAMDLINEKQVHAVIGLRKWYEVAITADLGDRAKVSMLSFADTVPHWAVKRWPFLVQATHQQYKQMNAVAAIVGTWRWRKVNFIYEDTDSGTFSILPHLIDALQQVGTSIENMVPLPPLASFDEELEKLQRNQCRVFIVHTSLSSAKQLFLEAKKMGLMEKDTVWITTTSITDHFDFLNSTVQSAMDGVLGVKTYYPKTGTQFKDFNSRFQSAFHLEYPKEVTLVPGISALQAYDAARAVLVAMGGRTNINTISDSADQTENNSTIHGQQLLQKILQSDFTGLTGKYRFTDGALAASDTFQIVNVFGKAYREIGYWSEGFGFSKNILNKNPIYNMSMEILGNVLWPGSPRTMPRGWALPTNDNPLIIGVPENPTFNQFVNVRYDVEGKPSVNGYSIEVFKLVVSFLPYYLPYELVPYNGTYDSLVKQIYLEKFDAVVGDTSIVSRRCDFAEFSHPWSESGVQMVVHKRSLSQNRPWLFLKPFTTAMWSLTAFVNIYNGFAIWLMERTHHPEFNGSAWNKVGTLIWLAFITLFSLQGDRLHSNLSRITMLVWLFVSIIIIQSYTASLTSMLTIPRIQLNEYSIEYLKKTNAKVGCDEGSFVQKYLEDVFDLNPKNIKPFATYTDYPLALERGEIVAVFLVVPYVKLFLANYCKDFVVVGPTYTVGGFGFVFPTGSPILPDISKAVLEVTESGKLLEMENILLSTYNCSDSKENGVSLGVSSFSGLFYITGGTTTITVVLYLLRSLMRVNHRPNGSVHTTTESGDHIVYDVYIFDTETGSEIRQIGLGDLNNRRAALQIE
ncbi:hypothetical protein AQUCO_01200035v1 [Aquilegia coerulea]|uniref:Glutamate receptor n=1 Tax=Aquilegia coerulea TaxID=218851 RepID=A0A2G5E4B6_AQUCA|nr:hypothetical protein AQUCO_01200035v1 [Aquilegia coerulea]